MESAEFVGQLESGISAKFKTWDLYRAALGGWRFVGEVDAQRCEISACGIVEALTRAIAWQPLPVVPRQIKRASRQECSVRGSGRYWTVEHCGDRIGYVSFSTKRKAEEWLDQWVANRNQAADRWRAEYGWTEGRTEGVDFRWEL